MAAAEFQLISSALLAIAAASDVASRRIPNSLVLSVAVLGLCASALEGGAAEFSSAAAACVITGAVMVLAWRKSILGGGDVKLAAAAATCVGLVRMPTFVAATAISGGIIAAMTLLVSAKVAGAESPIRAQVPYGTAIACGALWALVSR